MVTTSCNIRCRYCYETHKDTAVIKFEHVKKFFKWVLHRSIKNKIARIGIKLMGGEVLQFPELCIKIIEYGEKLFFSHGIFVSWFFSTNGTCYALPGVMDLVKKYYKYFYIKNLSFDGSPKAHDKNRVYSDGIGTAAEILKSYDEIAPYLNIYSIGGVDIDFNYVLAVNTINTFADDVLWFAKYMSPVVNIILQDSGIYCKEDHITLIERHLGKIYEIKKDEIKNGIRKPIRFFLKKEIPIDAEADSICCYNMEISIDSNGNIIPCVGLNHTIFKDSYAACHIDKLKSNTKLFGKTVYSSKEYLDKLGKEKKGGGLLCMARFMGKKEDLDKASLANKAKINNLFIGFNDRIRSLYGIYA
jgi:sulfatase maturation enzyme AslB (radical SAM superfamily)